MRVLAPKSGSAAVEPTFFLRNAGFITFIFFCKEANSVVSIQQNVHHGQDCWDYNHLITKKERVILKV